MALDFPSGVDNDFEWTDPSNGVTYVYDAVKNSWTALGGPGSGGGLGPDDIAAEGGLEINVDGKLQVKTYDEYGIELDATNGVRQGDNWSAIPSLPTA